MVAAIAGAIAFATLPLSFQSFWILRVARDDSGAHGDLSVLTNAAFLFLGIGAVIGFTVAATRMRPMRAALFGSVFGLVLSLVAMTINWSEVNEVTAVANIVYYMVPGLCAGLASGWVSRVLGGSYRKTI